MLQRKLLPYDKSGEEHFNLISALHKSVRNSDPDAVVVLAGADDWNRARTRCTLRGAWCAWRAKILASRNRMRCEVTIAAMQAFELLGPPEGHLALGAGRGVFVARAEIERRV